MKALFVGAEDEPVAMVPSGRLHVRIGCVGKRRTAPSCADVLTKRTCVRSEVSSSAELISTSGDAPSLEIAVQPEKYFRARYISEGSRGPMRGRQDSAYPTVKICGYSGPAVVDVYLSSPDGGVHDNVLVLGTNSIGAGEVVTADGGLQCIRVHASTASSMEAVFSNISVRRLRKFEIDSALRARGVDPESHDCDRGIACLKFVAHIPGLKDISVLSDTFQCSSQPGAPEIFLVSPSAGSAAGGDSIALVGKRFKAGFKVRFFASTDQGHWESWAPVNRDISNQGAAVITLPRYGDGEVFMATKVQIEIRIGPEREPFISEPAEFTYLPPKALEMCACTNVNHSLSGSLPPTPVSQHRGRAQSCSPPPVSLPLPTTAPLSSLSSSESWEGMLTNDLFGSIPSASETDLFPSNVSTASSSMLSDISTSWSDFSPLFPNDSPLDLCLPSSIFSDSTELTEFQDWNIISQAVTEFTTALPSEAGMVARNLNSLVQQRNPLLHEIFTKCKSAEVTDVSPAYLMKRQLSLYLPLLQGL